MSVPNFAQRGEHLESGFGMHRKNTAEILERDDAEIADLPEQSALRAFGGLFFRCAGKQCCRCHRSNLYNVREL
jgi:hypothetical protein